MDAGIQVDLSRDLAPESRDLLLIGRYWYAMMVDLAITILLTWKSTLLGSD